MRTIFSLIVSQMKRSNMQMSFDKMIQRTLTLSALRRCIQTVSEHSLWTPTWKENKHALLLVLNLSSQQITLYYWSQCILCRFVRRTVKSAVRQPVSGDNFWSCWKYSLTCLSLLWQKRKHEGIKTKHLIAEENFEQDERRWAHLADNILNIYFFYMKEKTVETATINWFARKVHPNFEVNSIFN